MLLHVTHVDMLDIIQVIIDLDFILKRRDQLYKPLNKFCYLNVDDLPNQVFVEVHAVEVELLELKKGETTMK